MYSLISVDDREVNKAKGINKKLRHEEYVDVLFNKKLLDLTQRALHVELTLIRRRYYVDTWKTKFRQISTSFSRTFSM